jgi:hypothetical protein
LLIAAVSLGWNVYRDVIRKPKLVIRIMVGAIIFSQENHADRVVVTITNFGPGKSIAKMLFQPYQIKRIARAEAEAEIIRAQGQIEVSDLQRRAMRRFLAEESKKQENIEAITSQAIPQLEDKARPRDVEDDWIANFFDKCRIVSDQEMQQIWAKVLAGEANSPGTYSKRTVNFLSSLDKTDAALFTELCGFGWQIGDVVTLVYDEKDSIYTAAGITFNALSHLDDIGLISFEPLAGFKRMGFPKRTTVSYYGRPVNIEFQKDAGNDLDTGKVLLTQIGQQLAPICGSEPVPVFVDYVLHHWNKKGLLLSSPYPRNAPKDVLRPSAGRRNEG